MFPQRINRRQTATSTEAQQNHPHVPLTERRHGGNGSWTRSPEVEKTDGQKRRKVAAEIWRVGFPYCGDLDRGQGLQVCGVRDGEKWVKPPPVDVISRRVRQ